MDTAAATTVAATHLDAIHVVVRVRPLLERERRTSGESTCVTVASPTSVVIHDGDRDVGPRSHTFTFDSVFGEHASQEQVYTDVARPVVQHALEGINATILAYGQTSSGKTYTMDGHADSLGIIPRAIHEIFAHISLRQGPRTKFLVRASYAQVHNEVVSDLIRPDRTHLSIREDERKGVYVEGLSEWIVRTPDEILSLMAAGARARSTAATLLNEQSSRSHAVFTLVVEQSQTRQQGEAAPVSGAEQQEYRVLSAKLNLVDLAGSERVRDSGATGSRLKETQHINLSLSALGNVISALSSGDGVRSHVPYRDAKLTRLLADSLGGNCKTTVIANLSPATASFSESLSTLHFTQRAKTIKNRVRVNEDVDKRTLLRRYEKELHRLRGALESQRQQVVGSQVELLRNERLRAQRNHRAAQLQLDAQYKALAAERQQKLALIRQIETLEHRLIGGSGETDDAAQRQEEQDELASKQSRFESERQRQDVVAIGHSQAPRAPARARLDDCGSLLSQQRDIMEALTRKLEERDATLTWLHKKLGQYEVRQRDMLMHLGVDVRGVVCSAEEYLSSQARECVERNKGEDVGDAEATQTEACTTTTTPTRTTVEKPLIGPTEVATAMRMFDLGDEEHTQMCGKPVLGHGRAASSVAPSPSIAGETPVQWDLPPVALEEAVESQLHISERLHTAVSSLKREHEQYKTQAETALARQQKEMLALAAETEPVDTVSVCTHNQDFAKVEGDLQLAKEKALDTRKKVKQLTEEVSIAAQERVTLRAILQNKVKVGGDLVSFVPALGMPCHVERFNRLPLCVYLSVAMLTHISACMCVCFCVRGSVGILVHDNHNQGARGLVVSESRRRGRLGTGVGAGGESHRPRAAKAAVFD